MNSNCNYDLFYKVNVDHHQLKEPPDTCRPSHIKTTRFFMSMQGWLLYIWLIIFRVSAINLRLSIVV
jgi:hypothetical protein